MSGVPLPTLPELLLTRRGLVFVEDLGGSNSVDDDTVRAFALELAAIGYVPSAALQARLTRASPAALRELRDWSCAALLRQSGGGRKHEPLFRSFPAGIPEDTAGLWWRKVLVHFVQSVGQPCLFCGATGTTHVLDPCSDVVCDRCFDGSSYSACPICERPVEPTSPFFRPAPVFGIPRETVTFKRIDLGGSLDEEARALFLSLCQRKQALSPADREALVVIVRALRTAVLPWVPATIPVRENVALVFGTLFAECDPVQVLPHAARHLATATDVLRLIGVQSGTDGSLLPETIYRDFQVVNATRTRFWTQIARLLGAQPPSASIRQVTVPIRVRRFKVARLSRPLRRALLGILEGLDPVRLVEDMLRHRSYWVWLGEFLHPHEYAARFPNVARAFQIVRGKGPDGTPAPPFETWSARLERTVRARNTAAMVALLAERPGELARRLDHALRIAGNDGPDIARVLETFRNHLPNLVTPVLVTLAAHLPRRRVPAAVRVFWPKGRVAMGASRRDGRTVLPDAAIDAGTRAIEAELLRRFAAKPAFAQGLVDGALRTVVVPFNERTASPASVSVPRGSRIAVPPGKQPRLFLHWCRPENDRSDSDLDLSVAFYDRNWTYAGVCSYYELRCQAGGRTVATSAGDLRDAPWPDGATELVDVDLDAARAAGIRYAVMVVNNYSGLPFSRLDRGFAGLMLREDLGGAHFDPRTVELKFTIAGENGIFLPLVFDLEDSAVHWLDVQARGELEMNNVESSKRAIAKLCPDLIAYFASGTRMSLYNLGLLHAAARCQSVIVRGLPGSPSEEFFRRPDEDLVAFHDRIRHGNADRRYDTIPPPAGPSLAILYRGDLDLPAGSGTYALFREQVVPTLAASDLL